MSRKFWLFAAFLFICFQVVLSAHPHMWIRGTVKPILGPRGLIAVDVGWRFDEYNNASLIREFDENGDGLIDEVESETIRDETFPLIYQSEYYLIVDIDGLRGTPMEATDFRASVEEGQLSYTFRVPLEITIRWEDMDKVGIFLFDPTYFVDFRNDGMEVFVLEREGRKVLFSLAERELETRGYGRVKVVGLQAGYEPGVDRPRPSVSTLIKDKSYLLQERLASYTRRVINEQDRTAFWAAIGIAFIFGLIHVLGPGHGKVFTLAYFSSKQAKVGEGLLLSALINILDSLSAFLLVGLTYGILSMTIQNTGAVAGRVTRIVAYSAISLLGLGHVIYHFFGSAHKESHEKSGPKSWMLALTVGLIPCPVSSALLAYGVAEGVLWFSILLVLSVSIGGMVALSIYSALVIGGKAGLVRFVEHTGMTTALEWFEVLSMLLLAVFGIVLLIGIL